MSICLVEIYIYLTFIAITILGVVAFSLVTICDFVFRTDHLIWGFYEY